MSEHGGKNKINGLGDGTGHPARFGYVKCVRCGCWRPKGLARSDAFGMECDEAPWCIVQSRSLTQNAPQSPEAARPAKTGLDPNGDAV